MIRRFGLMISLMATSCGQDPAVVYDDHCNEDQTPYCGDGCPVDCGCFSCLDFGDVSCREGKVVQCQRDCFEIIEECSDTDACVISTCAESVEDCDIVREAYELQLQIIQGSSVAAVVREGETLSPGEHGVSCPDGCKIVPGDCAVGLETCWLVGYRTREMDRLAALYERLGCPGAKECDCPSLDVTISCQSVEFEEDDPNDPRRLCVAE